MLMQSQGVLRVTAPCPVRDSAQLATREGASAVCKAYMASPSFLIGPYGSGHHIERRPKPTSPFRQPVGQSSRVSCRQRRGTTRSSPCLSGTGSEKVGDVARR